MTPEEKLEILGESAKYDISCCGGSQRRAGKVPGIYYASGSHNEVIPILKTLFTNKCRNDCSYCGNRISRDAPRVSFTSQELADLFMKIYRKEFVVGMFLSTGVAGSTEQAMEKMIKTAEILRFRHRFRGYIHLKIIPGSQPATIRRAMALATGVSVNIECPTAKQLSSITTGKDFMRGIIGTMDMVKKEYQNKGEKPRQTTQFIVGAAGETDQEIISTMDWLRRDKGLYRTYFSAFTPVESQLPSYSFTKLSIRKFRLYQTEFLQRLYGYSLSEIYFSKGGELPNNVDPKLNSALHNLDKFPIEINKASFRNLLHIPGIGKITAQRILEIRKQGRFTSLFEITKLGAITKRAAPFILINGKQQGKLKDLAVSEQLPLGI
ncbi:radical SAM protein [Candidatus Margulisiibacteriota bacterium]